ncbi:MAG: response regulator transcription factor [Rhodospirillales bacterium]|jgi:two-component system CheB/CheR fusion protein
MAANAVYIVEDDRDVCTMLHAVLADEGLTVEEFDSGEAFVAAHPSGAFGCLVVDAGLPGMSGLELVQRLRAGDYHLAAIMLTGQANVPMAVEAMKAGAVDFMQKPVSCKHFVATVRAALDGLPAREEARGHCIDAVRKLKGLTARQKQVLDMVVAGVANKNIAADLGISQRTVENHRAAIMRKSASKSLPALVRLVEWANRGFEAQAPKR